MNCLSESIRRARSATGLSQVQLAVALNVGLSTVQRWESGASVPTHYQHVAGLNDLGVDLSLMLAAMGEQVAA